MKGLKMVKKSYKNNKKKKKRGQLKNNIVFKVESYQLRRMSAE